MEQPQHQENLDEIRREIDRIDDGILKLIAARLDVVERVRAHKAQNASLSASPIRPGREAQILRRLLDQAEGAVPADLCFRIWRALIAAATLKQAPIRIHGSAALFASAAAQTQHENRHTNAPVLGFGSSWNGITTHSPSARSGFRMNGRVFN